MTALVVTGLGMNCEEETAAAYRRAGAAARVVHASDLFAGRERLGRASIVHLSGGFSFGDDLGSGRVFATRLCHERLPSGGTLRAELRAFVADGGLVFGVCNGFQILVRAGLLPNLSGDCEVEVSLTHNASGGFVDRWVGCAAPPSPSPAFEGLGRLELPIRHGEGRLVTRDADVRDALVERRLVALVYDDDVNGAELRCAALTDPSGRFLGAMPHPEAHLTPYVHPAWPTRAREGTLREPADGLRVFQNLVDAARAHGRPLPEPSP